MNNLEICRDCGHATDTPNAVAGEGVTFCPDCRGVESYDCVEVCESCYGNAFNMDELCDDCKFMAHRAFSMGATKGTSLAIRQTAQRGDLSNV